MFYESLIILNISTLNFSEGVPASVLALAHTHMLAFNLINEQTPIPVRLDWFTKGMDVPTRQNASRNFQICSFASVLSIFLRQVCTAT